MSTMITAFAVDRRDGAGWVSRNVCERERFAFISVRRDTFLNKCLWAALGILAFPFLHPIFCRYTPILSRAVRRDGELWLNLSQTFALSLLHRDCVLVCHDLQCHNEHRFDAWVRWSERILLSRAKRVVVLSARDAKVVRRYYRVPLDRIENIGPLMLSGLHSFSREYPGCVKSVAFLGSMARKENREGLAWFVERILPACPKVEVVVIGQLAPRYCIAHPRLRYVGFVEDLRAAMAGQGLMIAPMFSRAGIKVKVVEALLSETPVLGTTAAYIGLSRPKGGWCSNDPAEWIRILNHGGTFVSSSPPRLDPRSPGMSLAGVGKPA